jgi:superfamily I DNA and RNA helicase
MPFFFLFAFIVIYIIALLRSLFAATVGFKIAKCLKLKYKKPVESDNEDSDDEETKKKSKVKALISGILRAAGNGLVWVRNFFVWCIRQKSTTIELRRLFNKIVGAYLSFISFFFLRIMTTSFQIFGCDWQPNGSYTFKESPDIIW